MLFFSTNWRGSVRTGGGAGRDARSASGENEREVHVENEQNLAENIGEQHHLQHQQQQQQEQQ